MVQHETQRAPQCAGGAAYAMVALTGMCAACHTQHALVTREETYAATLSVVGARTQSSSHGREPSWEETNSALKFAKNTCASRRQLCRAAAPQKSAAATLRAHEQEALLSLPMTPSLPVRKCASYLQLPKCKIPSHLIRMKPSAMTSAVTLSV